MKTSDSKIILEDTKNDFLYDKSKSNISISFNRISFIFYFFYYLYNLFHTFSSSWFKKV